MRIYKSMRIYEDTNSRIGRFAYHSLVRIMSMDIEILNRTKERISRSRIIKVIEAAAKKSHFDNHAFVSVVFVGAKEIKVLNKKYRGKNKPTDVLTFSFESTDAFKRPSFIRMTDTEIFFCPEQIRANARKRNVRYLAYQDLLLVHAVLHAKGMDHETEREAKKMEQREQKILATLS